MNTARNPDTLEGSWIDTMEAQARESLTALEALREMILPGFLAAPMERRTDLVHLYVSICGHTGDYTLQEAIARFENWMID